MNEQQIDTLVAQFESDITDSFEGVTMEVPDLEQYDKRRPIERALEEASSLLYSTLEDLFVERMDKVLEDLGDVFGESAQFMLTDAGNDTFYVEHKDTGIQLRVEASEYK